MPFLSVITRCYKRPTLLARNVASLEAQTDPDYEQLFIVDEIGRGIPWANQALATAEPIGDYVLVLDDDDILRLPQAIDNLKGAAIDSPDIILFKVSSYNLGILPPLGLWGKRPQMGQITTSNFISRNDIWKKHVGSFNAGNNDDFGDYMYISAVWEDVSSIFWLDRILVSTPEGRRFGAPE